MIFLKVTFTCNLIHNQVILMREKKNFDVKKKTYSIWYFIWYKKLNLISSVIISSHAISQAAMSNNYVFLGFYTSNEYQFCKYSLANLNVTLIFLSKIWFYSVRLNLVPGPSYRTSELLPVLSCLLFSRA